MPKPPSNVIGLSEAFPLLQRTVEKASGLDRMSEIVDVLSGCLGVEPKNFERNWFRYRQGGKTLPSFDTIHNIVWAARTVGWLPPPNIGVTGLDELDAFEVGHSGSQARDLTACIDDGQIWEGRDIEDEVANLLDWVDMEYQRRQSGLLAPLVRDFVSQLFETIGQVENRRVSPTMDKGGRKAPSFGMLALPIAVKAFVQELTERVQTYWPEAIIWPAGLDGDVLDQLGDDVSRKFFDLAEWYREDEAAFWAMMAEAGAETLNYDQDDDSTGTRSRLFKQAPKPLPEK